MNRKPAASRLIITVLIVFFALNLSACQTVGQMIWSLVPTPDLSAYTLPVGSTPVGMLSIPTRRPPASIGVEQTVGNLAISVKRAARQTELSAGKSLFKELQQDEEYLIVGVDVRCISADKTCRLSEFDFGVSADGGRDYPAEFSSSFDGVGGLFEGGEIKAGERMGGDIIFVIARDAAGLMLNYPRMYNFGDGAQFLLDQ